MTKKWYEKNTIIICAVLLFFPLGLLMMWRYSRWNIWVKAAISVFVAAVVCVVALWTAPDAASISIKPNTVCLEPDMIKLIEVDISPQNTNPKNIRYISGDNSIARGENSQIKGISPGYTEIYAEDIKSGVKSNIIKVTVIENISSELSSLQNKINPPEQTEGMVYVGSSGTKYHRYNCNTLGGVKNEISIDDAVASGKTPCSKCKP